jgi:hypothetical protein
MIVSRSDEIL